MTWSEKKRIYRWSFVLDLRLEGYPGENVCGQEVQIKHINLGDISRDLVVKAIGDVSISQYIGQGCFQKLYNGNSRAS